MSVVKLQGVVGRILRVSDLDILDETPLLDIKPYIEQFDSVPESRSGWMQASEEEIQKKLADDRFL